MMNVVAFACRMFVEARCAAHGLDMLKEVGYARSREGHYLSRPSVHMDCFHWVRRDSYLPVGSQNLKAVAKVGLQGLSFIIVVILVQGSIESSHFGRVSPTAIHLRLGLAKDICVSCSTKLGLMLSECTVVHLRSLSWGVLKFSVISNLSSQALIPFQSKLIRG